MYNINYGKNSFKNSIQSGQCNELFLRDLHGVQRGGTHIVHKILQTAYNKNSTSSAETK